MLSISYLDRRSLIRLRTRLAFWMLSILKALQLTRWESCNTMMQWVAQESRELQRTTTTRYSAKCRAITRCLFRFWMRWPRKFCLPSQPTPNGNGASERTLHILTALHQSMLTLPTSWLQPSTQVLTLLTTLVSQSSILSTRLWLTIMLLSSSNQQTMLLSLVKMRLSPTATQSTTPGCT